MQVLLWFGLAFNDVHQYISTLNLKPASAENVVFRALKITSMPSLDSAVTVLLLNCVQTATVWNEKWKEFLVSSLRVGDDGIKRAYVNSLNPAWRVNKISEIFYQA